MYNRVSSQHHSFTPGGDAVHFVNCVGMGVREEEGGEQWEFLYRAEGGIAAHFSTLPLSTECAVYE